jgi:hypothetical protein
MYQITIRTGRIRMHDKFWKKYPPKNMLQKKQIQGLFEFQNSDFLAPLLPDYPSYRILGKKLKLAKYYPFPSPLVENVFSSDLNSH